MKSEEDIKKQQEHLSWLLKQDMTYLTKVQVASELYILEWILED